MEATHNPSTNFPKDENEFNGLKQILYLSVGAKVYLCMNLNIQTGLYNSSEGTVVDIIYDKNSDPRKDQPSYVLVMFENYKGSDDGIFPIFPVSVQNNHRTHTRT